jgi:ATP-dependent exoDNAse (exonuclease V) beta subunit
VLDKNSQFKGPIDTGSIGRTLDRIRRLVLLSDDRDLRSIPEAAKGIDAVRLMTMHGSKGLEFPVVHIPGMNLNTVQSRGR